MSITVEEYKKELEAHDWYCAFSDDHRVWQAGDRNEKRLFAMAKSGSDEFKEAYNRAHAKRFNTEHFCKPYNPPFKDLPYED